MNDLIAPEALQSQLAGPNPPTVIDVRGREAWRAGHIAGARHIPFEEIAGALDDIPRDKPVVTY